MIANRAQDIARFVEEHGFPVEINKPGARRSERQNRLYWKWMQILGDHTGYSKDDMHEVIRERFAPTKDVLNTYIVVSTSDMTPTQMTHYMSQIKRWAYDMFELILPEPDDQN